MKTRASCKKRQGGAVAIIVGFSLVLLIGFLAMVIDLGHLYLAKSELQNGADAAALAGAKELNGTGAGVASAIGWAQQTAGKNDYDFDKPIFDTTDTPTDNDIIDIWVGTCPEDSCMVPATPTMSDAMAAGRTFLKVHTGNINDPWGMGSRDLVAWFAPIWNIFHVSTYGMAVAGRYIMEVTPIGVCAVDVDTSVTPHVCGGPGKECGFLRGVAYNVPELNPLADVQPDVMYINPVNAPPDDCSTIDPSWNSRDHMAPFLCTGKAAVIRSLPGAVFVNTGTQAASAKDINSRFGVDHTNKCDVSTAPPDTNVREYPYSDLPRDWMDPTAGSTIPTQQGITIDPVTHLPRNYVPPVGYSARPPQPGTPPADYFSSWGALWSYARERNWSTGNDYGLCDWGDNTTVPVGQPCNGVSGANLYRGLADQTTNGYPTPTPAATNPPYFQTSGKYFRGPDGANGVKNRRVLNLAIIDCGAPVTTDCGNKGKALPVLAVGKFFMPVKADFTGSPKKLYGEFGEIVAPPLPPANIRLYR